MFFVTSVDGFFDSILKPTCDTQQECDDLDAIYDLGVALVGAAWIAWFITAAPAFTIAFPNFGRKRRSATDEDDKTADHFRHLAELFDKDHCLPRVLCEAAFNGRQENATVFERNVAAIAKGV